MKKYLMTSVAVLAFAATFTGCSKAGDLYDEGAIEKEKAAQKTASFEEAFKNRYGEIDKNNDWGFGSIGVATTRSAVAGRANAFSSTFTFPSTPDASIYAESVPTGVIYEGDLKNPWNAGQKVENYDQVYNQSSFPKSIWVDANAPTMQFDNANTQNDISVYVVGEVAPSSLYLRAGCKLYLTKGAKLTLPGTDYSFGQDNMQVYVADGAELICNGKLQFSQAKLYNNGTVTAKEVDIAVTGMIYNSAKGLLDIDGNIKVSNKNCVLVNDGTINATKIVSTDGSKIQNNGLVDLVGDTEINSNNDVWVNNGKYITENFTFTAGSADVINNCMLTVRNKFYIGLANTTTNGFKVDGGVVTKDFEAHGPANIFMASSSVFKVTNQAKMDITVVGNGIYGPESGDYAVFQAKDIVWGGKNNFCVSYFNNLYVVADSHFEHSYLDGTSAAAQANGGVGNCPTYYFDPTTVKMYVNGAGKPNYTIASSVCNPGFGGDDNNITYAVRIICEDLGASDDFDFNDVVFDAFIDKAANKTYIKVLAAGGTLPLTVGDDEHEVHAIFNVGTSTMVNTQRNAHYATKTDEQEFVINKAFASYKDIPVKVAVDAASAMTPDTYQELKAEKGAAPQKIAVSTTFEWCDERQQIETKYENFTDYVTNSGTLWQ